MMGVIKRQDLGYGSERNEIRTQTRTREKVKDRKNEWNQRNKKKKQEKMMTSKSYERKGVKRKIKTEINCRQSKL